MDLGKEELRATKNTQSSADSAEKTADEMFEELGYIKDINDDYEIEYRRSNIYINFNKTNKKFSKGIEYDYYYGVKQITMQELQAINKKVEEMRVVR